MPISITISALEKRTNDFRVRVSFKEPDRERPIRWEGFAKPNHTWLARNAPGATEASTADEKVAMWDKMTGRAAARLARAVSSFPKASKVHMRVAVEEGPFQVVEDLRVVLGSAKAR